jgi:type II secretory pathway component GspD/PulD (secretin)
MLRKGTLLTGWMLAAVAWAAVSAPGQQTASPTLPGTAAPAASADAQKPSKEKTPKEDRNRAQKEFLEGAKAMQRKDSRAALDAFTRAAEMNPGNRRYSISADIARQHLVQELIQQADKEKIQGHFAEARAAIVEASRVDPGNAMVAQHADELTTDAAAAAPKVESDDVALATPIALQPKPGLQSFHLHTNERDLINKVLTAYGIQPTLDATVGSQMVRYDVDDVNFAEMERTLGLTTGTFLVPLDPVRALVAKDSKDNRTKFERNAMETVYLPGLSTADLTDVVTVAKNVFSVSSATATPGQSAVIVRAPVEDLTALNATLNNLLEGKSEMQLDVAMYEVDRTKATNMGAIIPTQTNLFNVYSEAASLLQANSSLVQEIISSGLAAPGDWPAILAILIASGQIQNSILTQPFGIFGGGVWGTTGITYSGGSVNMQLNSSKVHSVDQLQVRVVDGEEGVIKVGEKYPIETSSYSSLGGSSLNIPGISSAGISSTLAGLGINLSSLASAATEAIPQVQYQDIGLTLDVTPKIENPQSVSLKFDLKLTSLAGSTINSLPVLNNREYQAITSLKVGESAVLVSSLSRQESNALTGIPGLSDIPGFEGITNKDYSFDYSELAIVITPHLVRSTHQQFAQKMYLVPHPQ